MATQKRTKAFKKSVATTMMAAGVFRAEFRPSTRPDGSFAFRHPVNLNRITPKQKSMAPENCSATRATNPF
jgi:hypothetical protein